VKHPSYGELHTHRQTDRQTKWHGFYFSAYAIISFALRARNYLYSMSRTFYLILNLWKITDKGISFNKEFQFRARGPRARENNGKGNLHKWPNLHKANQGPALDGHKVTSPSSIKRKGGKGGGVCECICLFGFMCRCAHAAIDQPFSTWKKGKKHPRLRLT
jgi:hypothetical protein